MRLTGGTLLFFLTWALVTIPAAAAKAKLFVNCTTESGEPVANIQVFAQELKAQKVVAQKSNKKGVAEFKKLPEGIFRVVARGEGYEPILVEFFTLKGGEEKTLDLKFKVGDSTKQFYFEDPAAHAKVDELFKEAVSLLEKNEFESAAEKLQQALTINPTSPGARQNLALAYANQQKWDLAEQQINKAIENVEALKLTVDPGQAGPYDEMITSLRRFLTTIPAMKIQMEADAALREGNNEVAVTKLEELSKLVPNDSGTLYNLALTQAKLRRFEDAKKTIDKALAIAPNDKNIQELKRLLLQNEKALIMQQLQQTLAEGDEAFKQGKYEEALAKYQKVQAEAPPEIQGAVWAGIARAHRQLNHDEPTVQAYQKAIETGQDKNKAQYAKELADYYFSKDMTKEGVQVLTTAYKDGSEPIDEALYQAAAAMMKENKKAPAKALFEETLKANPQHPESHYELGMIYFYDDNDPVKAKSMLTKYTEIGKDSAHLENAKAVLVVIEKTPPAKK